MIDSLSPEPYHKEPEMDTEEALKIVLELARQNIVDYREDADEHERQTQACDIVEEHFGDA